MWNVVVAYYTGFALSNSNEVDRWLRDSPLLAKEKRPHTYTKGVKLPSNLYLIFAASWVPLTM